MIAFFAPFFLFMMSTASLHSMDKSKTMVSVTVSNTTSDTYYLSAHCKTLFGNTLSICAGATQGIIVGAAVEKFPIIPAWELYILIRTKGIIFECNQDGATRKGVIPFREGSIGYAQLFDKLLLSRGENRISIENLKDLDEWSVFKMHSEYALKDFKSWEYFEGWQ